MNGYWKWIAGILAAFVVGFMPGYIGNRDAPTGDQFSELQRQEQKVELQMAVLVAQNKALIQIMKDAQKRIILLQTQR